MENITKQESLDADDAEDEVIILDIKRVQPVVLENKQPCVDIPGKQKKSEDNAVSSNIQVICYQNINSHSKPYLVKL